VSIAVSAKGKFTNGWKYKSSPTKIMVRFLRDRLRKHGGFLEQIDRCIRYWREIRIAMDISYGRKK